MLVFKPTIRLEFAPIIQAKKCTFYAFMKQAYTVNVFINSGLGIIITKPQLRENCGKTVN